MVRFASSRSAAQVLVYLDRRVARRVDAAGDPGLDLAERDLVGDVDRRLESGAAGLLDVVGGGVGRERAAEHGFAGEVEVAASLQHRAGRDFAEALPREPEAPGEAVERRGQHVLVRGLCVGAVAARERDPVAAEDGCAAWLARAHEPSSCPISSSTNRTSGQLAAEVRHPGPARLASRQPDRRREHRVGDAEGVDQLLAPAAAARRRAR